MSKFCLKLFTIIECSRSYKLETYIQSDLFTILIYAAVPYISDFILPFLRPYMGVIPNPKMAFIFPISCILALIFPILIKYFPKCVGKGSFPKSQIKSLYMYNTLYAILNKSENATLQYSIFCEKVLDEKDLLKLNNVFQTSSK